MRLASPSATRSAATDVVRRHRPDWQILLAVALLVLVGLVMLFAIGPKRVAYLNGIGFDYPAQYFFWHQLGAVALGAGAFYLMSQLPYQWFLRFATALLMLAFLANLLLWLAGSQGWGIATCTNGACRWFDLGTSIQPSEFLKIGLIFWVPAFLRQQREEGRLQDWLTFGVLVGVIGLALLLVVGAQRDLGTGVVIALIARYQDFYSGSPEFADIQNALTPNFLANRTSPYCCYAWGSNGNT